LTGVGAVGEEPKSTIPAGVRMVRPPHPGATRIVLVRHGESRCSEAGVVGGIIGCTGLTDAGRSQAEVLASRLERTGELKGATAFYSSVLPRAIETGSIISGGVGSRSLEMLQQCSLCELHPGDADGLTWSEFGAKYGDPRWDEDPSRLLAPGGESWTGFVSRASSAVAEIAERHPGEQVVVSCHAGVVEATMIDFVPASEGKSRLDLRTVHTSLTEWEHSKGNWRLIRYNDSAHLLGV
jgi:probable phosphoglycerate mutase